MSKKQTYYLIDFENVNEAGLLNSYCVGGKVWKRERPESL